MQQTRNTANGKAGDYTPAETPAPTARSYWRWIDAAAFGLMLVLVVYAVPALKEVASDLARQQERIRKHDAEDAERDRVLEAARQRASTSQATVLAQQERIRQLQEENLKLAEQLNVKLREKIQ